MRTKTLQQRFGMPAGASTKNRYSTHAIDILAWGIRVHGDSPDAGVLSIPGIGLNPPFMSTELHGVLWRQMVVAVWRMWAYTDRPVSPVLQQILAQNGDVAPRGKR